MQYTVNPKGGGGVEQHHWTPSGSDPGVDPERGVWSGSTLFAYRIF